MISFIKKFFHDSSQELCAKVLDKNITHIKEEIARSKTNRLNTRGMFETNDGGLTYRAYVEFRTDLENVGELKLIGTLGYQKEFPTLEDCQKEMTDIVAHALTLIGKEYDQGAQFKQFSVIDLDSRRTLH